MITSACGADVDPDGEQPAAATDGVRVADIRFDGQFQVTAVTFEGESVELISVPVVAIETEFGGLEVTPGCNTYFGSFTLTEDGTASFTITGGSRNACDELGEQEEAVIAGLRGATRWDATENGYRFVAEDGDELIVTR